MFIKGKKSEVSIRLANLDENKMGKYACYVYASTGTMRHEVGLKRMDNGEVKVHLSKQTKKIGLLVEKLQTFKEGFMSRNELTIGEDYQFECITGEYC